MTLAIDFRFELLFIFLVLISAIALITVVVLTLRARRSAAKRWLMVLGIGWAAYVSLAFLVAAVTSQRIIPIDQDLCFDEMCFAVVKVQTASQLGPAQRPARADGTFYVVTVRASSRAHGRAQSEKGLRAQLWSPERMYDVSAIGQSAWEAAHPQTATLTTRLGPGQAIYTDRVFDVPLQATGLGLVLSHGFTPGYFVIGECPLFHRPTILRVSPG